MATIVEGLETCAFCRRTGCPLKACSKCKTTKYCGRDCQLADWKAGHKNFCAVVPSSSAVDEVAAQTEAGAAGSPAAWPSDMTVSASEHAKNAHIRKWKKGMFSIRSGAFSSSPIYKNALQAAIANPSADWPRTIKGSNNNRLDLISAVVEKLNVLLEFFYVHAAWKSGSKKKGALLLESETMLLEDLVNRDAGYHMLRPVAIHYFTQTELVQYFVDFCSSKENGAESTAKQLLETCNLEDPKTANYFTVVIAMKHQLDKADEGISHCHTILSLPNQSFDFESQRAAIETMNSIYGEAEGLTQAQVLEVDLVSGDVTAYEMCSGSSQRSQRATLTNVGEFAKSLT
jgi:hypothetical protein